MTSSNSHTLASVTRVILSLYLICTLIGMAPMNIGFGLVAVTLMWGLFKNKMLPLTQLGISSDHPLTISLKQYRFWGLALSWACVLSLTVALIWPFAYADHEPIVTLRGYNKLWYLLIPYFWLQTFIQAGGKDEQFQTLLKTWWFSVLALTVVAVIQFNTGWPINQIIPTNPTHYHAILFFGHHLSTASILIFPTFAAFAIALGTFTRDRKIHWLEVAVTLGGLLILFLSYARAAWLALPVGIVLILIRYLKHKRLFASIIALAAALLALSQTSAMKERITNDMGIQERFQLWEANIDFFKNRPLTGIGWLKTAEMSEFYFKSIDPEHYHDYFWGHAHSNYFEMLGGAGLLGLLTYLGWIGFTFWLALSTSKLAHRSGKHIYGDLAWGILVALVLLHINGLTNVTFWEGKVLHQQMLGIGFLLIVRLLVVKKTA